MILLVRKPLSVGSELATMADQASSRLLSLPPELRNAIWSLVLLHDIEQERARGLRSPTADRALQKQRERVCANVLRTCKQANKEGTPILYGDNTFAAHSSLLAALPALLLRAAPTRLAPPVKHRRVADMIRRYYIHVRLDTDPRFTRLQADESFTGVEELEIEVFQSMYGSCDFSVLQLFEGVRGVGKATVHGSVGDGKYAEYLARRMMSPIGTDVPVYSEEYIGGSKVWHAWVHGNR